MFSIPYCDVRYDFRIKTIFDSSLLTIVCRGDSLIYVICVCLRIVVSNIYCGFRRISMLPVSLYCPFLIGPLVFSNVYLLCLVKISRTAIKTTFSLPFLFTLIVICTVERSLISVYISTRSCALKGETNLNWPNEMNNNEVNNNNIKSTVWNNRKNLYVFILYFLV
jgi:hypothetical protein